ncbi:MAG: papain-like cysteine peptidase [Treponema sp.]|jgi:hypothetical protein|nr:papain-like cysteine peptidase [Treponema sp.]
MISAGYGCRPAHHLKEHELRYCASPLDWMGYTLETAVHLYKTKFRDFFVEFAEEKDNSLKYNCRWFVDTKNDILSMHYHDIDNSSSFRKKMQRRFAKINRILRAAKEIAFVSRRNEDITAFENFLLEMSKLYSGNITYINIRHNENRETINRSEKIITNKLKIIEHEFYDIHPDGEDETNPQFWIGNQKLWDSVFKNISIRRRYNFLTHLLHINERKYP